MVKFIQKVFRGSMHMPKLYYNGADTIMIRMPFSEQFVEQLKRIPGKAWNNEKKLWLVPCSRDSVDALLKIFSHVTITLDPSLIDTPAGRYIERQLKEKERAEESFLSLVSRELTLRGLSTKTIRSYVDHIKRFKKAFNKPLEQLTTEDVRQYIFKALSQENRSHSYVGQAISALKFLYEDMFGKEEFLVDVPRPKKEKKLPDILSQQEVLDILQVIENPKHKALMMMVYSSGLRVGEVVRLRIEDIDSERMMVHVKQGKGSKDRFTMLSKQALNCLREYYKKFRPEVWLFPGIKGCLLYTS
ncbi:MAG: site-specific integrase, partial [Clostridia bacterium]|nr:site-specific integrase [Clostridia bacterium]